MDSTTATTTQWVSLGEVAAMLGRSTAQTRRIVRTVGFPAGYRWMDGGSWTWEREQVEAWIVSRRIAPIVIDQTVSPTADRRRRLAS